MENWWTKCYGHLKETNQATTTWNLAYDDYNRHMAQGKEEIF